MTALKTWEVQRPILQADFLPSSKQPTFHLDQSAQTYRTEIDSTSPRKVLRIGEQNSIGKQ